MKLFSLAARAGSTACHARLFPLEGAGSLGRAGRHARSIFLPFLLLHRGRGAAIPAGTLRGDHRHWGCPCPHRQFHTNGGSGQSTRGLNALQQNHVWFQPIRKPNNRRQSTKNQHTYVRTHGLPSPSSPAEFNRLTAAFWALWMTVLKPALQVLLRLLFQPPPGSRAQLPPPSPNLGVPALFLAATGIPLHRHNVTQHEWTCFSYSFQIKVQLPLGEGAPWWGIKHHGLKSTCWREGVLGRTG